MKSIQNQYRDLKEGKMSQANFMRNLRMTMPQYITNVTSFNDSIKILKNKGILNEDLPGMASGMHGSKDFQKAMGIEDDSPYEKNDEDKELEDLIKKIEDEESGKYTKFQDYPGGISEAKKKKEPKAELHPNQINPDELRMGIKVEMEHTDDPKKAEKIALDHLAENPYYYTALKLSGIESPTKPKEKAPKDASKKAKKKDQTELVDKANQMKKVKVVKENLEEDHAFDRESQIDVIKKSGHYGADDLDSKSDEEIQKIYNNIEKLLKQKQSGIKAGVDLGSSFDKFKAQLEEIVREVLAEMQSNQQETDEIAMDIDETFDGRDNLDAENEY